VGPVGPTPLRRATGPAAVRLLAGHCRRPRRLQVGRRARRTSRRRAPNV